MSLKNALHVISVSYLLHVKDPVSITENYLMYSSVSRLGQYPLNVPGSSTFHLNMWWGHAKSFKNWQGDASSSGVDYSITTRQSTVGSVAHKAAN